MKKIAVVLFFVLLFGFVCYAEDLDFSFLEDYSIEQIEELKNAINSELCKRGLLDDSKADVGVYEVGKDIKSGAYVAVSVPIEGDYGPHNSCLYIWNTKEGWKEDHDNPDYKYEFAITKNQRIILEDNNVIEVMRVPIYLFEPTFKTWSVD